MGKYNTKHHEDNLDSLEKILEHHKDNINEEDIIKIKKLIENERKIIDNLNSFYRKEKDK